MKKMETFRTFRKSLMRIGINSFKDLLANQKTTFKVNKLQDKNIIHLDGNAPDKIASVIVLEIEGKPDILPLPAVGKSVKASSVKDGISVENLFDGDPKNKWQPKDEDKDKWVEIDLKNEISIGASSVAEPWHPWDNKGQKIEIQYKEGNKWIKAVEFTTNGDWRYTVI